MKGRTTICSSHRRSQQVYWRQLHIISGQTSNESTDMGASLKTPSVERRRRWYAASQEYSFSFERCTRSTWS